MQPDIRIVLLNADCGCAYLESIAPHQDVIGHDSLQYQGKQLTISLSVLYWNHDKVWY